MKLAEQSRGGQGKHGPRIGQGVFDRSAGDGEFFGHPQVADCAEDLRGRVFRVLCFVENYPGPVDVLVLGSFEAQQGI